MAKRPNQRPYFLFWEVFVSLLVLVLTLVMPTWTQAAVNNGPQTAPIVIDGRMVAEVSDLQNYTAQERAKQANESLAQALQLDDQPLEVEVVPQGQLITLRIAGQHLLTVTDQDVRLGVEPMEQAEFWQRSLNRALEQAQLERSPAYLRRALSYGLGLLIAAGIVYWGFRRVRQRWWRQQLRQGRADQPDTRLVQLGLLGLQVGGWVAVVYVITEWFPTLRVWRYTLMDWVATSFQSPILTLNQQEYAILDLMIGVALLIGLWLSVRAFTLVLKSRILQVTGVSRGRQEAIAILTQYGLTFLGLMIILQVVGLDVSSLVILGSALGVGLGFGLQKIVNNFISGIIILLDRPIEVGDFINVGDLVGTVERIGTRSTEIRTLDQVTIIVPNSRFLEQEVVNWNHGSPVSRLHLPVGVAYGSDIERVQLALLEAVQDHPEVLAHPQPQVWFQGFGDSALEFELLLWCCEPRQQFRLKSDLNYRIEACLRQYDVEVPFPQRDLHVRSPQVDQLIDLLIQKQAPIQPHLYYPDHIRTDQQSRAQPSAAMKGWSGVQALQSLPKTKINLDTLVTQMRGSNGVEIKDRRHRLNLYPQCFVGSEAVAWLMRTQKATREEAIRLGQLLIDQGILHHVLNEHAFQDAYYFYRFYSDEQQSDQPLEAEI